MGINFADDAMDRTNMMNIEWNVAKQEYMKTFFAMAIDRENCKKYVPFKNITWIHDDWNAKQNVKTSL